MSQYTKSLLHFNGANNSPTFTDETGKVWTRNGNAKISTAQSKFGGASGYFDGTGDYIQTPAQADFNFGTGDFTVDFWFNSSALPVANEFNYFFFLRQMATSTAMYASLYRDGYNDLKMLWGMAGTLGSVGSSFPCSLSEGSWYHFALVRASETHKCYLDGVLKKTDSSECGDFIDGINTIGAHGNGKQFYQGYIDEFRISNTARWTANFTPPTSEYSIGLALNVVIDSPENIREVINRIAYEASSMEYWDAGQHNLVYLPTHTTVSKTIDANRIDLGTISVGYTDRVDLLNSMILWYRHYWSGYSGDAAFRKSVSDSDATSIAKFGTLSSDPLQFKYLGNTNDTLALANAQRAIRWILTQQKNPRVTVEFTGGYYLTDLTRSNLIQFSFTARDELDKAFSGLVSTSDKFIIMDIVRGTGQIKIKAVQLITL